MKLDYPYHTPVMTSDNQELGIATRWYRRTPAAEKLDPNSEMLFLKVMNFDLGDDLFLPASVIDEGASRAGPIRLNISLKQVHKMTLSRMPRFVAYGASEEIELAGARQAQATSAAA